MDSTVFRIIIPLFFALIVLPILIRFIIGRVIYIRIRKDHLEPLERDFLRSDEDRKSFDDFRTFLTAKINSPFATGFFIREDLNTLLLLVQNSFSPEENEKPRFTFSAADLIKCAFLLISEVNALLKGSRRFTRFAQSRVSTLRKISRAGIYYNRIYQRLPFLKVLRKGRITGKIVRILLIPLIGLPSIILSITASLVSLVFTEIIWRYYYSILLIKFFSYALILYGDRKALIRSRLERFSPGVIRDEAALAEFLIDPEAGTGGEHSTLYEQAFLLYQQTLGDMGISPEKDLDFDGISYRFNSRRRFIKKLLRIPLRAASKFNPLEDSRTDDRGRIIHLVRTIASPYDSSDKFWESLRLIDLFDSFHILALLGYGRILNGSLILENISVDFLLTAKNLSDELLGEVLQKGLPFFRKYYKTWRLYRKGRYIYKALRSGNPAGLIFSLTSPIAVEGLKSGIRDYIYRRAGRITLYCYESNYMGKERLF